MKVAVFEKLERWQIDSFEAADEQKPVGDEQAA